MHIFKWWHLFNRAFDRVNFVMLFWGWKEVIYLSNNSRPLPCQAFLVLPDCYICCIAIPIFFFFSVIRETLVNNTLLWNNRTNLNCFSSCLLLTVGLGHILILTWHAHRIGLVVVWTQKWDCWGTCFFGGDFAVWRDLCFSNKRTGHYKKWKMSSKVPKVLKPQENVHGWLDKYTACSFPPDLPLTSPQGWLACYTRGAVYMRCRCPGRHLECSLLRFSVLHSKNNSKLKITTF